MRRIFHQISNAPLGWRIYWVSTYVSFLILDIFASNYAWLVTTIKLVGIACCAIFCLRKPFDRTLFIAFIFTLVADLILACDTTSIYGLSFFCFAQLSHFSRLHRREKFITKWLVLGFGFTIIGMVMRFPVWIIAIFYAIHLVLNCYKAILIDRSIRTGYSACAATGFCLFVCCDLCVAISYLAAIQILPVAIQPIANYLAWAFYYPSQVLIANSVKITKI